MLVTNNYNIFIKIHITTRYYVRNIIYQCYKYIFFVIVNTSSPIDISISFIVV